MNRGETVEEKLKKLEELFARYGAAPTELDEENRARFGDRAIYELGGTFFRAGTAEFDGRPFLILSSIDKRKFAEVGILDDIDALPADCGEERMEKAVRYALGVEPYPEVYPEPTEDDADKERRE